ncbi:hypothetical protein SeLEV6574_g08482, partial [Synchytrium endobioticum]
MVKPSKIITGLYVVAVIPVFTLVQAAPAQDEAAIHQLMRRMSRRTSEVASHRYRDIMAPFRKSLALASDHIEEIVSKTIPENSPYTRDQLFETPNIFPTSEIQIRFS